MAEPALFLDRDGVIVEEVGYLHRPEDVVLYPGVAEAIATIRRRGVPVVVATNQSGIGRGKYGEADLHRVSRRIDELLAAAGARIDATYFCPHRPDFGCDCRKPAPGLLRRAAAELGLDLARSVMVGDKGSDLGAARAARCAAVLVRTGYGAEVEAGPRAAVPDAVFDSLAEAVPWLAARFG